MDLVSRLRSRGRDLWPVALAALIALVAPLRALDEASQLEVLAAAAPAAPFEQVFVVTASSDELRGGTCGTALGAVTEGRPRALLLVPPVDAMCVPKGYTSGKVDGSLLAIGRGGAVVGLAATDRPELRALGLGEPAVEAMGPP